jgi:hypothetical protein
MFIFSKGNRVVDSTKATTKHHDKLRRDVGHRTHCLYGLDSKFDKMLFPFSFLLHLGEVSLSSLARYQRSDV